MTFRTLALVATLAAGALLGLAAPIPGPTPVADSVLVVAPTVPCSCSAHDAPGAPHSLASRRT